MTLMQVFSFFFCFFPYDIVANVVIVLGDDGADDFGDGEDFEGFAQYGDGQEFDESIAGASGSGGGDGKGREQLLILYQEQSGFFPSFSHNFCSSLIYVYQNDILLMNSNHIISRRFWLC